MEHQSTEYVPESLIASCAATAMMLVYSAPTPGTGSRYLDGRVAHESKALSVISVRDALGGSGERRVGKECRSLCDWSSDVCSSDLRLQRPHAGDGFALPGRPCRARVEGALRNIRQGRFRWIGRASCRERV